MLTLALSRRLVLPHWTQTQNQLQLSWEGTQTLMQHVATGTMGGWLAPVSTISALSCCSPLEMKHEHQTPPAFLTVTCLAQITNATTAIQGNNFENHIALSFLPLSFG